MHAGWSVFFRWVRIIMLQFVVIVVVVVVVVVFVVESLSVRFVVPYDLFGIQSFSVCTSTTFLGFVRNHLSYDRQERSRKERVMVANLSLTVLSV